MTLEDREPAVEKLLVFARDVVSGAGEKAMSLYGKGNAAVKFDEGLVTSAELELSEFFRERLNSVFPGHGIFGDPLPAEDYVHGEKRYLWIYDPLDGVANFQAGIPIWSISLALLENFWPVFGVTFMQITGDLFYAVVGRKAYWGDREIRIPDTGEISNESVLLTYSRFHNHYQSTFPGKIRNLGSTAAHVIYVARGRAEGALLANVSYRDLAAAQIILEAAGGRIHRLDGRQFHLSDYLSGQRIEEHLIAAPEGSFEAIRMYLKKIGEE
ncbi:MAG: inositol monophosphatase [Deltaproteobacteria bacterium]|jgi:myo-inositol-1(or 4)-monophosphatase|nr:inositol monophosphatase [Deltaproteobacteria bacterium]